MRNIKNIVRLHSRKTFPDGVLKSLPVDQFPVHRSNINAFGFPSNDIQVLRELSAKGGINNDRFEFAASRLNAIRAYDNSKKTIEELWKDWRPAWYQSPTELIAFEEWYLSKYPFEAVKEDENADDTSVDVTPPSDENKSTE